MKISKLVIKNFRGIEARDIDVAPGGFVAKGRCGSGKSSLLYAIRAALCAQGATPDAIRLGEDKAEIMLDLDDVSVRRVITRNSPSKLTVEKGGMKASKPSAYLTELIGSSPLDPIDFFLAKPPQRKAQILAALPITVTRAQLETYLSDDLPLDFDLSGHGLEVVERARKFFYDERTLANKEAADAKATAERLTKESRELAAKVSPGPVVPTDEARAALAEAERALLALENRKAEAGKAAERTASQRARITELRASAAERLPITADVESFRANVTTAKALVADLEDRLVTARRALSDAQAQLDGALERNAVADRAKARAADLAAQADTLEAALAAATVTAPSEAELTAATVNVTTARALVDRADAQAHALAAVEAAKAATDTLRALEGEAADLDTTVKRLANEAPADLLKTAEGIPGLSLEGDEVKLDGKALDMLCGAEQLRFAVELARRANAKTKILIVDGLERLDPELMDVFVAEATRDDWQLCATRVDRGDVVLESIEADDDAKAAE